MRPSLLSGGAVAAGRGHSWRQLLDVAAVVEAVEHLLEVVGEHGRAQGDALLPLGRELEAEGRVLIPLLDSTPDVTSAQGEEVMAVNLADRDFAIFFLLSVAYPLLWDQSLIRGGDPRSPGASLGSHPAVR